MSQAVLSVEDVQISLPPGADRPHAVSGIDLAIAAGEILCLLGESGSGKSMLAYAVAGLLPERVHVSRGRILLADTDLLSLPPESMRRKRGRDIAMIFQEPMTALNPVMRCGDQIEELLREHSRLDARGRRARILAMFESVRLPEPERIRTSYPHQLSGGQRQRVMIAMALCLEPKLLIADEPTTALDVTTQAEVLSLISSLQRQHGTAVLFITHDMGVVAEIADRVVVMERGRCVEQGSKEQVLRQPREPYTRMLLAAVPSLTPRAPRIPAQGEPVLSVKDLGKVFERGGWFQARRLTKAAADVSFELRRGETLGIVGESGSGKSTLARLITRLIDPSSGQIYLDGQRIDPIPREQLGALRQSIQIVFQDPYRSLDPRQRVLEAIIEGPLNFGVSRQQALARARELAELVRLDPEALIRYPSQFSGGQRQRIAIARALALEPRVLVCDEAVSALDVSVQAQVLALLADIQRRLELAIVFITHDLRVAAQICDRVLVMSAGRVVEQGPTHEVFQSPRQPYTQRLLASAPGREYGIQ